MAKSLTSFASDTAVAGVSSLTMPVDVLNFGTDWRVIKDEPNEVIITNLTTPLDKPSIYRFTWRKVNDAYKQAGIATPANPPTYTQVMIQYSEIKTEVDSVDATYEKDMVFEAHTVIKVPNNTLVTAQVVLELLQRLSAGYYSTGVVDSGRLQAILRGSLVPSEI